MNLTKKQTEEVLSKFISEENGLHSVLEMVLNSLMLSERSAFLRDNSDNKGNDYKQSDIFGHGKQLELQ